MSRRSKSRAFEEFICWAEKLAACLDHGLSKEEFEALDHWERSKEFTGSTDQWPGWAPRIGPRPGAPIPSPVLLERWSA
jgi:hypothetical protein